MIMDSKPPEEEKEEEEENNKEKVSKETAVTAPPTAPMTPSKVKRRLFSFDPVDLGEPPEKKAAIRKKEEEEEEAATARDFPVSSRYSNDDNLPRTPRKVAPALLLGLTPKPSPDAIKKTLLRTRRSPMAFFKKEKSLLTPTKRKKRDEDEEEEED